MEENCESDFALQLNISVNKQENLQPGGKKWISRYNVVLIFSFFMLNLIFSKFIYMQNSQVLKLLDQLFNHIFIIIDLIKF